MSVQTAKVIIFVCVFVVHLVYIFAVDPYVLEAAIPVETDPVVVRRGGCRPKEKLPNDREFRIAWFAPKEEFHNLSAATSVGTLKLALAAIKQHDYLYGWQLKYKWKRNAQDFNPSAQDGRVVQLPRKGTIVFNAPEDKDAGIYQCFADNGYGVSASVKINLREAKLAPFSYAPREDHTAYEGDTLTLNCVPPVSYPRPNVYWVIKEPEGHRQAIDYDKRVSLDLEGKLQFSNVRKTDEQSGKSYSCMATNLFTRESSIGPEHVIKVLDTTEMERPISELWTSPADQAMLKGVTMKLKCIFGGNPTPDVNWMKADGVLPDRAKLNSFGQELIITDLELSDGGTYICEGFNTEPSQTANKTISMRIESSPYWLVEPKSAEKGVGQSASFICKAGGDADPTYSWYINVVVLEDFKDPRIYLSYRIHRPNANNLTITNLTLEDYMVIQCNASNKHDYVFADVFLNVMVHPPTQDTTTPTITTIPTRTTVHCSTGITTPTRTTTPKRTTASTSTTTPTIKTASTSTTTKLQVKSTSPTSSTTKLQVIPTTQLLYLFLVLMGVLFCY